jgi:hypothetical protein
MTYFDVNLKKKKLLLELLNKLRNLKHYFVPLVLILILNLNKIKGSSKYLKKSVSKKNTSFLTC